MGERRKPKEIKRVEENIEKWSENIFSMYNIKIFLSPVDMSSLSLSGSSIWLRHDTHRDCSAKAY